ncbi:hypothetical protein ABTL04_20840, partial [Acinetobacter baumannii]
APQPTDPAWYCHARDDAGDDVRVAGVLARQRHPRRPDSPDAVGKPAADRAGGADLCCPDLPQRMASDTVRACRHGCAGGAG